MPVVGAREGEGLELRGHLAVYASSAASRLCLCLGTGDLQGAVMARGPAAIAAVARGHCECFSAVLLHEGQLCHNPLALSKFCERS